MSQISLKASETKILTDAAAEGGRIVFPDRLKESSQQRIAGLFVKHALAEGNGEAGELRMTLAGYRAVGLRLPRETVPQANVAAGKTRGAKKHLVEELLGRGEGASLDELMAATGWLRHTTRAVLSRIRSGGQALAKSTRDDGAVSYRIVQEPAPTLKRSGRRRPAEVQATAAA